MDDTLYFSLGLLALGVLWINTLLIAAAALKQARELRAELRALTASGTRRATVSTGHGPEGALVTRTVHQVGRAMTVAGPDRILLTESRSEVEVHGGMLAASDGTSLEVPEGATCRIWIEPAPEGTSSASFDAAWGPASTGKGLTTQIEQRIVPAAEVWYAPGALIATADPSVIVARRVRGLAAFAVLAVLLGGAITAVIFVPPLFGTVSTIGAALGLAFFVLVQPAGVRVRNWARLPDRQPQGRIWQRP